MPYIYSGVCLAAMFGAIFYERRQMKKEEAQLREKMLLLAEKTKNDLVSTPGLTIPMEDRPRVAQIH